jgi:hypothetical protein
MHGDRRIGLVVRIVRPTEKVNGRRVTNLLVVRHQVTVAGIALGQPLQQCLDAVVVAAFLLAELVVMLLDEFLDLFLVHLH